MPLKPKELEDDIGKEDIKSYFSARTEQSKKRPTEFDPRTRRSTA